MKVSTTDHAIVRTRTGAGRKAKPNPFAEVIASFDDGKTRQILMDEGEKVATVLNKLRAAAGTIDRSVTIELIGSEDVKEATGFYFTLRAKITRTRKDAATTEATKPAAKTAKATKK